MEGILYTLRGMGNKVFSWWGEENDDLLGTIPIPRMFLRPCLGTTQTFRVPSIIHETTSACTKTFMLKLNFTVIYNFSLRWIKEY